MQDLFHSRVKRNEAISRAIQDTPASELEIEHSLYSDKVFEQLGVPRIPDRIRRALNIVAAYRRWIARRTAALINENIHLRNHFVGRKLTTRWIPTIYRIYAEQVS